MLKKRLDYDNRINLQAGIAKGYSLRRIAETQFVKPCIEKSLIIAITRIVVIHSLTAN
ncbi:MAG TPA: hypothetical protein GX010_04105 [Erysipelotrichaceae bacterium]|nr:hypothetical protein [Erysipelotrichaceae bacterium]